MFKNLFDLSLKRTFGQSVGFYFAYLFLGMLLTGVISGIAAHVLFANGQAPETFAEGLKIGKTVGSYVVLFYCTTLTVLLIKSKKLYTHFGAILLGLLAILFSMLGSIFGLIPISILTRMDTKHNTIG